MLHENTNVDKQMLHVQELATCKFYTCTLLYIHPVIQTVVVLDYKV